MKIYHAEDLHVMALCLRYGLVAPAKLRELVERQAEMPEAKLSELLVHDEVITERQRQTILEMVVHNDRLEAALTGQPDPDQQVLKMGAPKAGIAGLGWGVSKTSQPVSEQVAREGEELLREAMASSVGMEEKQLRGRSTPTPPPFPGGTPRRRAGDFADLEALRETARASSANEELPTAVPPGARVPTPVIHRQMPPKKNRLAPVLGLLVLAAVGYGAYHIGKRASPEDSPKAAEVVAASSDRTPAPTPVPSPPDPGADAATVAPVAGPSAEQAFPLPTAAPDPLTSASPATELASAVVATPPPDNSSSAAMPPTDPQTSEGTVEGNISEMAVLGATPASSDSSSTASTDSAMSEIPKPISLSAALGTDATTGIPALAGAEASAPTPQARPAIPSLAAGLAATSASLEAKAPVSRAASLPNLFQTADRVHSETNERSGEAPH